VLNEIKDWIRFEKHKEKSVMWLHGGAGAGKSAIARTIAEWCQEECLLLSSFFFWRSDHTRNHSHAFLATLAFGISRTVQGIQRSINRAIKRNRHIFNLNLDTQFIELIYEPFIHIVKDNVSSYGDYPHVLVVDGLDECLEWDERRALLLLLGKCVLQRLPWKILVTSRQEQAISLTFDDEPLIEMTTRLALSNEYSSDWDIRTFLKDKLGDIKRNHCLKKFIPQDWPVKGDVDQLVEKSSGHFIFASTVVGYIQSHRHSPPARLDLVLNRGSSQSPAGHDLPFAELDQLYNHIFTSIDVVEQAHLAPKLVALIIMTNRYLWYKDILTPADYARTLGITSEEVVLIVGELGSIIGNGAYDDEIDDYYVLHASLEDFLFDRERSRGLWVDHGIVGIDTLLCLSGLSRHWISLSNSMDILDKIKLTEESFRHFMAVIDSGVLQDQFENCSLLSDGATNFLPKYLDYLKTKVSVGIFS